MPQDDDYRLVRVTDGKVEQVRLTKGILRVLRVNDSEWKPSDLAVPPEPKFWLRPTPHGAVSGPFTRKEAEERFKDDALMHPDEVMLTGPSKRHLVPVPR